MNFNVYEDVIEKIASFDNQKDNNVNKKPTLIPQGDLKSKLKWAGKSIATGMANGKGQDIAGNIGAVAGTILAKKKGAKLGKAIATGGLGGMIAGDVLGALTIPLAETKKVYKKEFGEDKKVDKKTLARVLGVNMLPTAALWGAVAGVPSLRKKLKKSMANGFTNAGKDAKKIVEQFRKGKVGKNPKKTLGYTKSGLKNLAAATVPIAIGGDLAAMPTYIATPQNLIKYRKQELAYEKNKNQDSNPKVKNLSDKINKNQLKVRTEQFK